MSEVAMSEADAHEPLIGELLARDPEVARSILARYGPETLAAMLATRTPDSALRLLGVLDPPRIAHILEHMPSEAAGRLLMAASPRRVVAWLRALPQSRCDALVNRLPSAAARELRRLLDLPPESVLLLLENPPLRLPSSGRVADARWRLADAGPLGSRLYLVDDRGRLDGRIDLVDLAMAHDDEPLASLAAPVEYAVPATADRESVLARLEQSELPSVPVVDDDRQLLGVVRSSTLLKTAGEVASIDMQTMVGAGRDERALSSAWLAVRKRHGWLQINLLTAFLAASVVGLFESTIAAYTALAVLLPVVAGQSGNAGAQALAVTMRGLALREVGISAWLRILTKEARVGLINGIGVALTTGLGVWAWSASLGLAMIICTSMILSLVIAGIAGASIPVLLTRLGQDPATSSSILLTTVTDVAGFFSFLGIATALSGML